MTASERQPGERRGGRSGGSPSARRVELVSTAIAVVLASKPLFGRSLLRLPAAVAAAALIGAMRRPRRADRSRSRTGTGQRARAASRAANRAREEARKRLAHAGGRHPEPEVIEVKSPAELERGIASATPRPTFPSRVDRGRHAAPGERAPVRAGAGGEEGGASGRRSWAAEAERAGSGSGEVSPHSGYLAPDAGAGVREEDLGTVEGPDAEPEAGAPGERE